MASRFSKGPWKVRKSRRFGWAFEIRNGHRDPIAVIYGGEADARLMGASLRMFGEFRRVVAALRLRDDLRASEKALLARSNALIAEVLA